MVGGNVGALLEGESVGTVGGIEDAVDEHAVNIEVCLDLVVADVEHLALHLGRIVEAVVGLELEVGAFRLAGKLLDGLGLGIGYGLVLGDEALQEGIDIVWRLGHGLLQRIGGIVGKAHELGLLGAQLGNLGDKGVGVEAAGAVAAVDGSLVDLTPEVSVFET